MTANSDTLHTFATLDLGKAVSSHHFNAKFLGLLHRGTWDIRRACIQNDWYLQTRFFQGKCRLICAVVVRNDNRFIPCCDAKVRQVVTYRACQHHSGNVISGKRQRALNCTCRSYNLSGPDPPKPVTRPRLCRRMITQLLVAKNIPMIINTCAHRAQAHRYVFHRFQIGNDLFHELIHRLATNGTAIDRPSSAPMGRLFQNCYFQSAFCCSFGSLKASYAATDHQYIAKVVVMFIRVFVLSLGIRCLTKTGRLANERFINVFPQWPRMDEHLVVKACRQKTAQVGVDRTHIELESRPVVLTTDSQAIEQLCRCRALVGLERSALAHVKQCVGFFRTRGDNTTRPVILE